MESSSSVVDPIPCCPAEAADEEPAGGGDRAARDVEGTNVFSHAIREDGDVGDSATNREGSHDGSNDGRTRLDADDDTTTIDRGENKSKMKGLFLLLSLAFALSLLAMRNEYFGSNEANRSLLTVKEHDGADNRKMSDILENDDEDPIPTADVEVEQPDRTTRMTSAIRNRRPTAMKTHRRQSAIAAGEGETRKRSRIGGDKCKNVPKTNINLVEWCYKQCQGCKNDKLAEKRWCRNLDCSAVTVPADKTNVRDHSLKMCDLRQGMSNKKQRWCRDRCRFCRGTTKCDSTKGDKKNCVDGVRQNSKLTRCVNLGCPASGSNPRMEVPLANPVGDDDDDDMSDLDEDFLAMMEPVGERYEPHRRRKKKPNNKPNK